MTFLEDCEAHFGSCDLYVVMGLSKDASEEEIKKAYRRMSLKTHPDRASDGDKETATAKFQILGKVYNVLSDKERRATYDETGCIDDEINDEILDWGKFWASVFPGLTKGRIEEYSVDYWGSPTEATDLKEAYEKYEGNMNKIMEHMYCRALEDEPRYRKMIQEWIDNEEVATYHAFTHETKAKKAARKRKYQKEAKEAKLLEKNTQTFQEEVGDSLSSLRSIIAERNEVRQKRQDAFLDSLAAKYVKPKKTKPTNATSSAKKKVKKQK